MITIVSMILLVMFLGAILLIPDKRAKSATFFDIDVTTCMRGFWCIIIMLVHIPLEYQNIVQDSIGSFAYVGVSFFFMTSGYGLFLAVQRNSGRIANCFWKRRLLKLLVPTAFVNVATVLMEWCVKRQFPFFELFSVNRFVRQLLFFYLLFWLIFKFPSTSFSVKGKCVVLSVLLLAFSLTMYFLDEITFFGWPVESFGFLYGIFLAKNNEKFVLFSRKKWLVKCVLVCCLSLLLGVFYLRLKSVAFVGDYIIKIVLGFTLLALLLLLNAKMKFGNRVARFLGKISFEIYLIHATVFASLSVVLGQLDSGPFIILGILSTVLLSFVINKLSGFVLGLVKKKTE